MRHDGVPKAAAPSHAKLRDKWALWNGPTTLRGANIWQKRVKHDNRIETTMPICPAAF